MEICKIENCEKKIKSAGMCSMHCERKRKYGDVHRSVTQGQVHGLTHHPLYRKWKNIRMRCNNPNVWNYCNYGGRGIRLSEEFNNPILFVKYIESLPNYGVDNLQLDRIDNNGNYERGNLRWATRSEQMKNRRPRKEWRK